MRTKTKLKTEKTKITHLPSDDREFRVTVTKQNRRTVKKIVFLKEPQSFKNGLENIVGFRSRYYYTVHGRKNIPSRLKIKLKENGIFSFSFGFILNRTDEYF